MLLSIAVIALFAEVGILLSQMKIWRMPVQWSRAIDPDTEIGQVVQRKRSLKVRAASSLTWYPLAEGDKIQALDTVMTGAESSARLLLHGQGELFLEPFTLIHFSERPRREEQILAFELNEGTVRLKSKDSVRVTVRSRLLEMKPDAEMVVAAGSVAAPPEILVTRGEVAFQSKQGEVVTMSAGQAYSLSPDMGVSRSDTKLAVVSKTPREDERVALGADGLVEFAWEGDRAEVIEWDTDPSFSSPSFVAAPAGKIRLPFKPGRYYWRVRRAIAVSSPVSFVVMPEGAYDPIHPSPNETVAASRPVELRWPSFKGAVDYQLEFSKDQALEKKVKRERTTTPHKRLGLLKPGKYYWRVRAKHLDLGEWPASAIFVFQVKNTLAPPRPKGVRILPRQKKDEPPESEPKPEGESGWLEWIYDQWFPSAHAQTVVSSAGSKLWMEFEWESAPGAARYRLQIAGEPKFREILAQVDTEYTTSLTELPDRSEYFWRVASIDDNGLVGPFSRAYRTRREQAKPPPLTNQGRGLASSDTSSSLNPGVAEDSDDSPLRSTLEPTPPYLPWHIRRMGLGYGAGYWNHSISGADFRANNAGFPPYRAVLAIQAGVGHFDAEATGSYARLRAVSDDPLLKGIQANQDFDSWSAEFSLWHYRTSPFGLRLRVRNELDYRRSGSESLALRGEAFLGFGIGWRQRWSWYYPDDVEAEIAFEVGPLGLRRGAGILSRIRWDFWHVANGIQIGAELSAAPFFRRSGSQVSEYDVELGTALVFRWQVATDEELTLASAKLSSDDSRSDRTDRDQKKEQNR